MRSASVTGKCSLVIVDLSPDQEHANDKNGSNYHQTAKDAFTCINDRFSSNTRPSAVVTDALPY
jgi:hypothetical protein